MSFPPRPVAFILAATNHGSLIVSRNDYRAVGSGQVYGVGVQILSDSCFDPDEIAFALALLDCRRRYFGDGVVAVDGGANIGVHSVEWARHMYGWGRVLGFEAQEVVYYALAGNLALNNCLNARVKLAALGGTRGELAVPQPDYFCPGSLGSLELREREQNEPIGQPVSYDTAACNVVPMLSLDCLGLERLDLVKLDVEGMELEVLQGGRGTLQKYRPVLSIEVLKSDQAAIEAFVEGLGYEVFPAAQNIIAVHESDPTRQRLTVKDGITLLRAV